jgi:hypothetical protein
VGKRLFLTFLRGFSERNGLHVRDEELSRQKANQTNLLVQFVTKAMAAWRNGIASDYDNLEREVHQEIAGSTPAAVIFSFRSLTRAVASSPTPRAQIQRILHAANIRCVCCPHTKCHTEPESPRDR